VSELVGSNLPIIKRQNRSAVLKTLLRHGPLPRREVGFRTLLTPSTITNLVGELLDQGLVREIPVVASPRHDRVGRRPVLLEINSSGGYVLGAYVGATTLTVTIGDLRARVLGYRQTPLHRDLSEEGFLDLLVSEIKLLLAEHATPLDRVYGIGVTPAGDVDAHRGLLLRLPEHPWRDLPLVADLQARLSLPVAIENSREAMALAEMVFGGAQGVSSLVLIHLAWSIGCSLVIDQRVYSGDHGGAGRLGHVVVEENGAPCSCGKRGCLNTIASAKGIVRIARAEAESATDSTLWHFHDGDLSQLTDLDVLKAADEGDPAAQRAVWRIATALGQVIANLILVLDPSMVVVAGRVVEASNALFAPLHQVVDSIVYPATGLASNLQLSAFGEEGPRVAGLTLALQSFVYSPALTLPTDTADDPPDERLNRVWLEA